MRIFIHKVVEGPFFDEDSNVWVLIVRAQDEGDDAVYQDALLAQDEDDHWEIVRWLNSRIDPWVITIEEDEKVGND